MSENIERIREEMPFKCSSVKQVVHEKKQDRCYEFGKNKKGKKDKKTQEKQSVSTDQETAVDIYRTGQGGHDKMPDEENQCGSIIDIEA
ncbi:MAG: hypothetical protein ACK41Q_02690 [Candidatus Brocadia sp.]